MTNGLSHFIWGEDDAGSNPVYSTYLKLKMEFTKDIIRYVSKFNSADEFLRSGGLSIEMLDKLAFGFNEEDIKTLPASILKIKWKDDWKNVLWEVEKSGLTKKQWSLKINLSEPIDVSYEKDKFYVEDGHHRTFAAKVLKKDLNVNLQINEKPIQKLGYKDYDKCMKDIFNQIKSMNTLNESSLVKKILIEAITQLPNSVKKIKNKKGLYDIDVNSIFLNPFDRALISAEDELEDQYYKSDAKKKYNAGFMDIGVIRMTIPVAIIYPGQSGLESTNLLKILNAENITELPEAVKVLYNDKNYIVLIDGHHRVASQILKGKDRVELILKVSDFK